MELTLHVNDKLKLYSKTFISGHHYEIVNLLYQPIIGIEATNLYITLWSLFIIEKGELTLSHRQLLTFFNWDLKKLLQVRERLEAIGLLNIYYHHQEGYYVYELRQPLTSRQFFLDSNLNVHLLYQVGEHLYEYLERKFLVKPLNPNLKNITKNFTDIYQIKDTPNVFTPGSKEYISTTVNPFVVPLNYDFDFELFSLYLNKQFVNPEMFTKEEKEAIVKEAALYNFDPQVMSLIVLECADDQHLDLNKLHEVAREYYKRAKVSANILQDIKPAMTEQEFSAYIKKKKLSEKEEQLMNYKTKTPLEFLMILQGNTPVPNRMLEVVNEIYTEYKLPAEVINVLIDFVRKRNDGRLPREYAKLVASTWVYNKITTAEAALEMVEKINTLEQEYEKRGEVPPTYRSRRVKRVVEVPEWMKDQDSQETEDKEQVDLEELKQLLESFK
ncbi:MAG: hypothetical protein GX676_01235 [Bacilli bacterium]|nr:hypothetical protein [Bacilli bacterium]